MSYVIVAIIFTVAGYAIACFMFTAKRSDNEISKIQRFNSIQVRSECQIHPSYSCLGSANCKGNPSYCDMAVLNNLAGQEEFD